MTDYASALPVARYLDRFRRLHLASSRRYPTRTRDTQPPRFMAIICLVSFSDLSKPRFAVRAGIIKTNY